MNIPLKQHQSQQLILDPRRKCGRCTICCIVPSVKELAKPPRTPCKFLGENQCSIYDTRPPTCQGFYCAWRLGYFTEGDRPDKIDALFSFSVGTKFSDKPVLTVDSVQEETISDRAYALAMQESARQLVLVRTATTRRVIGPEAELKRVAVLAASLVAEANQEKHESDEPKTGAGPDNQ
jgi:hypothetical protein